MKYQSFLMKAFYFMFFKQISLYNHYFFHYYGKNQKSKENINGFNSSKKRNAISTIKSILTE